jgi:tyrosine aminotransferase
VESARKAVIKHFGGGKNIDASDVILTSGVNMGLLYCLNAICNPGENILVPDLGYPFYDNLAPGRGV